MLLTNTGEYSMQGCIHNRCPMDRHRRSGHGGQAAAGLVCGSGSVCFWNPAPQAINPKAGPPLVAAHLLLRFCRSARDSPAKPAAEVT